MSDFRDHLARELQDPVFKREWDAQETEREVAYCIAEARLEEGLTQKELAERSGLKQSNLCRLENGNSNPSIETLEKVARGLGRRLKISFV